MSVVPKAEDEGDIKALQILNERNYPGTHGKRKEVGFICGPEEKRKNLVNASARA